MRVLFADRFPERQLEQLREVGCECELRPELLSEELPEALAGFDVLVVRSTQVTCGALQHSDLRLVVRAGAGTNTIDVAAASDRGIYVCNVPGKNAIAVAELAFGLLLAIDRNIPDSVIDLRAGRWDKARYQSASGLQGRQMGVVGLGAVGLELAERAAAFGMSVHAIQKVGRNEGLRARLDAIDATYHPDLVALVSVCDVLYALKRSQRSWKRPRRLAQTQLLRSGFPPQRSAPVRPRYWRMEPLSSSEARCEVWNRDLPHPVCDGPG